MGICKILSLVIPDGYAFYKFTPVSIYIQKLNTKSTHSINVLITVRGVVTLIVKGNQLEEHFSWLHNIFSFKSDSLDKYVKFYYLDLKED